MDWFKMQTVWGASVERLSDAEAGRFIKALYAYVRDGDEYEGSSGREDPVTWQALETLRKEVEAFKQIEANQKAAEEALKEKRRLAAKTRWEMQNKANASTCMDANADASTCTVCNASASENKNKKQKENNRVSKETQNACAMAFEIFWSAYPRHTAKQNALQSFRKLNPDDALMQTILAAIARQKQSPQWMRDGGQYIPHPATWLNQRRWEDETVKAGFGGKTVTAQAYTQRDYSEADLMAVSDDLIAEARAQRSSA